MTFDKNLLQKNAEYCLSRDYHGALKATRRVSLAAGAVMILGFIPVMVIFFIAATGGTLSVKLAISAAVCYALWAAVCTVVYAPSEVALAYLFLRLREGKADADSIGSIRRSRFGKAVGWELCKDICSLPITLIGLLPCAAGILLAVVTKQSGWISLAFGSVPLMILKAYRYSMMRWLLAENPDMTFRRAMQLSKKMTRGYRWKMFTAELSLLPYAGRMAMGGVLIHNQPYICAVNAEVYSFLKANAAERGYIAEGELPL